MPSLVAEGVEVATVLVEAVAGVLAHQVPLALVKVVSVLRLLRQYKKVALVLLQRLHLEQLLPLHQLLP
jgi:hypothetical protein